jgi:lipopolysaccharide transport system ATP-binding protein
VTESLLRLDRVWKSYPAWDAGGRTLRGIVSRRAPLLTRHAERWALKDVSLEVGAGQSVGIIGLNGAGKSTLLRVAAGVTQPTRGTITVPDHVVSVLMLGAPFDPSLTGRENALTAAIVTGFSRAQAKALLPAVLEFAELEQFADAPLRTYSDGMKLRLAFGVVAQTEPAALLIDEVMAVGDLRFQRKCMDRIREMRAGGTAVMFASHGLEQVASECDMALWLHAGSLRAYGTSASVIAEYKDAARSQTFERTPPPFRQPDVGGLELRRNRFGSQELTIDDVTLRGSDGAATAEITSGSPMGITLELRSHGDPIADPIVGFTIHRSADGVICCDSSTAGEGVSLGTVAGRLALELRFDRLDLVPGDYVFDIGVYRADWEYAYDFHWQAYPLHVLGSTADKGVYRPPLSWRLIDR